MCHSRKRTGISNNINDGSSKFECVRQPPLMSWVTPVSKISAVRQASIRYSLIKPLIYYSWSIRNICADSALCLIFFSFLQCSRCFWASAFGWWCVASNQHTNTLVHGGEANSREDELCASSGNTQNQAQQYPLAGLCEVMADFFFFNA